MSTSYQRPRTQLDLLGDSNLLERFVARGDQAAFAALVQRHGPLVLGVCRRVLRQEHDAEDAFQATFVVLARKGGTISKSASLASWLYKVAYRIAVRQRHNEVRRREQEQQVPPRSVDSDLSEVVRRELQLVLDEEVRRLPEKYRTPILLCYLQGQTNEEAAALLHCPTGTIKIRLLRGRELLRKRLVKRGLALTVTGLVGQSLASMADAAVSQPLSHATIRAATGGSTPAVTSLAQAAIKGMCMAKLKVAAVVMLTVSLLGLADGLRNLATAAQATHLDKRPASIEFIPTAVQYGQ